MATTLKPFTTKIRPNAYEGFEIRFKLENSIKFNLTLNTFKGYPSVSVNGTNEWQTVVVKFSEFSDMKVDITI